MGGNMKIGTKTIKVIQWTGTATAIIGAMMVSSNTAISGYGYVPFLTSSICWVAASLATRDRAQLVMQFGFMAINAVGIYRWLIA